MFGIFFLGGQRFIFLGQHLYRYLNYFGIKNLTSRTHSLRSNQKVAWMGGVCVVGCDTYDCDNQGRKYAPNYS